MYSVLHNIIFIITGMLSQLLIPLTVFVGIGRFGELFSGNTRYLCGGKSVMV